MLACDADTLVVVETRLRKRPAGDAEGANVRRRNSFMMNSSKLTSCNIRSPSARSCPARTTRSLPRDDLVYSRLGGQIIEITEAARGEGRVADETNRAVHA